MSGLGIRLYTDEDVDPRLAEQLSRQEYDVLSCHAAGNAAKHTGPSRDDEWQLAFAVSQGRTILVYNHADFIEIDQRWRAAGKEHFGIILSDRLSVGELVRRTRHHLDTYGPAEQYNLILWLSKA